MPRLPWSEVVRPIYREHNELADEAAKNVLKQRGNFYTEHASFKKVRASSPKYLCIFADGSHVDGLAACGYVVFGAWSAANLASSHAVEHWHRYCGTLVG